MTKSHKKISFIFLILVLLVGLWLIYQFPVQKYLAEQKFIEYTSLQRVDLQDIRSQKFLKDYKTGGYDIEVEYKSDPGLTYEYSYVPHRGSGKTLRFHLMACFIYDEENVEVVLTGRQPKYPPLMVNGDLYV